MAMPTAATVPIQPMMISLTMICCSWVDEGSEPLDELLHVIYTFSKRSGAEASSHVIGMPEPALPETKGT